MFLCFSISALPVSVASLSTEDIFFAHNSFNLKLHVFKYRTTGFAPQADIRAPTFGKDDPIQSLFRLLYLLFKADVNSKLFATKDLPRATESILTPTGV